jgi:nucleoside-diphosphate-sugar epimerase
LSQKALSTGPRRVLVFGGSGQIGAALLAKLGELGRPHESSGASGPNSGHSVRWQEVAHLGLDDLRERLVREIGDATACDVVFANGRTESTLTSAELIYANLEFPERVVRALAGSKLKLRFLTLGTIMERFPEACAGNAYLRSKQQLGQWVMSQPSSHFLHVRLHTAYGGAPKKHMFLGQMAAAIQAGRPFEMSAGGQLREYHHVDDLAVSLAQLLDREWSFGHVVEISSGKPLRLAELARGVFEAFGRPGLLKIGAISGAHGENTERTFERSPAWLLPVSREPLTGVIDSLKRFLTL